MPDVMGDVLSRGAAGLLGVALLVITSVSLMRTVVIPRALRSALSDGVALIVIKIAQGISRLRTSYRYRDAVLASVGPSVIILQLLTWLLLYLVAYGLLIYGVSGRQSLGDSLRQSGSSLLTLGFASDDKAKQTIIDFFAAATGPIVIALLIGFLPTIYAIYLEREQDVALLSGTAGEPAWGPELLARLTLRRDLDFTGRIFSEWAIWSARLRLTHVTYPVLVWVRSARASRHYVTSQIAVLDAAALQVSLAKELPHHEAYFELMQGSQAMETLYAYLYRRRQWRTSLPLMGRSVPPHDEMRHLPQRSKQMLKTQLAAYLDTAHELDHDTVMALASGESRPITLTRKEFDDAVDMLRSAGYPIDTDLDEAWEQFSIYRGRYEFVSYEVARLLDATPAPWTGPRRVPTPVMWPTLVTDLADDEGVLPPEPKT